MMRHVFMQAATGGAIVMALLTIGLLVFGWLSRPAAASNRQVASRRKRSATVRPKTQAAERPKARAAAPPKPKAVREPKPKAVREPKPKAVREPKSKLRAAPQPKPKAVPELKPKLQLVPVAGPGAAVTGPDVTVPGTDQNGHSSEIVDYPSWLGDTAEFDADASAPTELSAADGSADGSLAADYPAGDYPAADAEIAAPSWLGLVDPPDGPEQPTAPAAQADPDIEVDTDLDASSQASQPTTPDLPLPRDDESSWPDFLVLPEDTEPDAEQATELYPVQEPDNFKELSEAVNEPASEPVNEPASEPVGTSQFSDPDELAESAISPVALRMLGADPSGQPAEDDPPALRHQVSLGDDQIEVVLAGAAADEPFRGSDDDGWPAETPHLAWTPLPYDVPDDGLAFACVGAGDEGCLFIDLAGAPSAISITGDNDAAVRLAESIAHQLCADAGADRQISVFIVGGTVPQPYPATATPVQSMLDLTTAQTGNHPDGTDIVFCELNSTEDAFALARHVSTSQHRVVPVVLGHLPGAAWSFTAFPNPSLDDDLPPLDSGF